MKLGFAGLVGMAVAGLLSLMVTWGASPIDRWSGALFGSFDQRDIVPVGYAAFAFALGATTGLLIRRTLPAMATTLVQRCVDQLRIRELLAYQPASRYWAFQWYETAIFLGAAVLLGGFCLWRYRRRPNRPDIHPHAHRAPALETSA